MAPGVRTGLQGLKAGTAPFAPAASKQTVLILAKPASFSHAGYSAGV